MQNNIISLHERYNLTIAEASEYFRIGEKSLRRLISNDPNANYILMVGTRVLIKRKLFEQFIDETSTI